MENKVKRLEDYTIDELWDLRNQVVVNSVFLYDYDNNNHIDEKSLSDFFSGYYDYMWEIANEILSNPTHEDVVNDYDNKETLYDWFNCYDNFDWVVYIDDDDENN